MATRRKSREQVSSPQLPLAPQNLCADATQDHDAPPVNAISPGWPMTAEAALPHFIQVMNAATAEAIRVGTFSEHDIESIVAQQNARWIIPPQLFHAAVRAAADYCRSVHDQEPAIKAFLSQPYRERAREFGLIVDEQGHQQYAQAPTPFLDLLTKYGVDVPELPPPEIAVSLASRSKSRPWICGCKPRPIHIQVAISDLRAQCLKCGQMFRPKER